MSRFYYFRDYYILLLVFLLLKFWDYLRFGRVNLDRLIIFNNIFFLLFEFMNRYINWRHMSSINSIILKLNFNSCWLDCHGLTHFFNWNNCYLFRFDLACKKLSIWLYGFVLRRNNHTINGLFWLSTYI
jgi:hypothetical protein